MCMQAGLIREGFNPGKAQRRHWYHQDKRLEYPLPVRGPHAAEFHPLH